VRRRLDVLDYCFAVLFLSSLALAISGPEQWKDTGRNINRVTVLAVIWINTLVLYRRHKRWPIYVAVFVTLLYMALWVFAAQS
jgi:hypothetical protein